MREICEMHFSKLFSWAHPQMCTELRLASSRLSQAFPIYSCKWVHTSGYRAMAGKLSCVFFSDISLVGMPRPWGGAVTCQADGWECISKVLLPCLSEACLQEEDRPEWFSRKLGIPSGEGCGRQWRKLEGEEVLVLPVWLVRSDFCEQSRQLFLVSS